ncbi:PemK-like, MazF-like toxin of type II toxin-antitoxin system [Herbihabitans rhizosphaerae]|uniref:PemK-like, MazF-like toxin of type II toxin-antitoxin system n=1 Tax=Herbihabitans rhizosphaerae TaxID=1872711 RepID=A0A4Q7KCZ7_9PSEU|nr:type II toxin-antitoxin system PemK/MazF family toxin [Herbihabitans rhizosphaerae]RZS31418.1 PemK-like, MazF-like toxin of type II toxin-antitoxin system [Herbihabitans rhizosphaerae]
MHKVRQVPTTDRPDRVTYSPDLDGRADPGEIVWAWVPYEDDPSQGKDRPLLVVGRHETTLRALMLSSREPDGHHTEDWHALGSGTWDSRGRPSFLRLDRLYELAEDGIRREGSVLPEDRFAQVADVLQARYGWS